MLPASSPKSFIEQIFRFCLLLFASALLLNLAVDLLRCIWPWLLGLAVLGVLLWLVVWWLRHRADW
ncbi:hypothetical protein ACEN19_00210 [Corynebacterium auriscanis]|uniref:hypothetical protein n=1 Tax=Corynebacterium auriscanis TaxID=99807 RepID=UPI003CF47735